MGKDPEQTALAWMNIGASQMGPRRVRTRTRSVLARERHREKGHGARIRALAAAFTGCASVITGKLDGIALCREAVTLATRSLQRARYAHWALVRASAAVASVRGAKRGLLDDTFVASFSAMETSASSEILRRGDGRGSPWWPSAKALVATGDPRRAEQYGQRSLDTLRAEGDPLGVGWALRALANAELASERSTRPKNASVRRAPRSSGSARAWSWATTLLLMARRGLESRARSGCLAQVPGFVRHLRRARAAVVDRAAFAHRRRRRAGGLVTSLLTLRSRRDHARRRK